MGSKPLLTLQIEILYLRESHYDAHALKEPDAEAFNGAAFRIHAIYIRCWAR